MLKKIQITRQPSQKANGFTLTEILVVIVIIAVIATFLIPMIGKARVYAASTKSISNLGQIKSAMFSYTTDNNGYYPYAAAQKKTDGKWSYLGSWDGFLLYYFSIGPITNHPGTILSSSAKTKFGNTLDVFKHNNDKCIIQNPNNFRRSYAMPTASGAITVSVWDETDLRVPHKTAAVPDPARTILLTERPESLDNYVNRTGYGGVNRPNDQIAYQPNLNGNGKFNYLFADGHIESLYPKQTIGTGSMGSPKGMWTVAEND